MVKSFFITITALMSLTTYASDGIGGENIAQAQFELALAHLDKNTYEDNQRAIELFHQSATQGLWGLSIIWAVIMTKNLFCPSGSLVHPVRHARSCQLPV